RSRGIIHRAFYRQMRHIALVYPAHTFSTYDVAVGYSRAFKRLGFRVTDIEYYDLLRQWEMIARPLGRKGEWVRERATADVLFNVLESVPDLVILIDGARFSDTNRWHGITRTLLDLGKEIRINYSRSYGGLPFC
ncbi:MAG: hypothetical protein ACXAB4_03745, partial [Candidatus Hodarchaeales archaeon]